jgi:hypothetical protein
MRFPGSVAVRAWPGLMPRASRQASKAPSSRPLAPFNLPLHHLPEDKPEQMPQLLTGTGARAVQMVQGPGKWCKGSPHGPLRLPENPHGSTTAPDRLPESASEPLFTR